MKQISFSDAEFSGKKRVTRREKLLNVLDSRIPWSALVAEIEPFYPKPGNGRPPIGLERMLRMYVIQQVLGLSDEGTEDAVYDMQSVRRFIGVDLSCESAPDATTLLKFRRLLERHRLTKKMFKAINQELANQGLLLRGGTVVDATLLAAAPSTKNKAKARDPEMKQTKKGNQWYFGAKAHIGADAITGLVHSIAATAANESDVAHVHELLHGEEEVVFADAGYTGAEKRPELKGRSDLNWQIAERRGLIKALPEDNPVRLEAEAVERRKASIRAPVEHAFHVLKCRFGHRKVRYRGMAKNESQLYALFGLVNVVLSGRWLATT